MRYAPAVWLLEGPLITGPRTSLKILMNCSLIVSLSPCGQEPLEAIGYRMLKEPRMAAMAKIIVRHALDVQPGCKVLIDALDDCEELIVAVINEVNEAGGLPMLLHQSLRVRRAWLSNRACRPM